MTRQTEAAANGKNGPGKLLASFTSGLQGRLFAWTFLFVMVAEMIVFIPSLGSYYRNWLGERVAAAQIAALVYEANQNQPDFMALEDDILERAGVSAVILRRGDTREPLFMDDNIPTPHYFVDLGAHGPVSGIREAFTSLFAPAGRSVHVLGRQLPTGEATEVILPEAPLKAALQARCHNIFMLSLIIALITAGCVYLTVYLELVRPIRSIITSMVAFRQHPEDASRILPLPEKGGQLADAARALHEMQTDLRAALTQKSRLAALGVAISKINHDLRNMLASAQLIADRLGSSPDPTVQRITPQLVRSLDRAAKLCSDTLKYGRAEDPAPNLKWVDLASVCEDVRTGLGLGPDGSVDWQTDIPNGLRVYGDPDNLFRSVLNLARNSLQAIQADAGRTTRGHVRLSARLDTQGRTPQAVIDLEDDGPGIPEKVRDRLFQAFVTSARAGGSGLGLAIAHELTRAQGGSLTLLRSNQDGTVFRLILPHPDGIRPKNGDTEEARG